ncbi:MAG: DUF2961 domain-containing protein [Planctomycetes bacterium]|nr:DUF2961 domain-containing protein [Planctomycetota bacterium]
MIEIFKHQPQYHTRWVTFENPAAGKGQAARENKGAKGHPCEVIQPGQMQTLLDLRGAGIVTRFWCGFYDSPPKTLRSIRIDMYWDDAKTPAVSAPLGDFFCLGFGRMVTFESDLFSNPEGRSFVCFVPMPFRTAARIVLTNESENPILFFYEIDALQTASHANDVLYFHAAWNRKTSLPVGTDFEILPHLEGKGRYVGANLGVISDPQYGETWWGEGEVKVFLDGDTEFPTLCNTGAEDYIATGWGMGVFSNRWSGCTVSDKKNRQWSFYRFHIPDPVFFHEDCRVTIQEMGGAMKPKVMELIKSGAPLKPVTVSRGRFKGFDYLFDMPNAPAFESPAFQDNWVNFLRSDDYTATAYFYLDRPESGLPPLASVAERIAGIIDVDQDKRADV